MRKFYTIFGPAQGPLRGADTPGALGVMTRPDDQAPIGTAIYTGIDDHGLAVWQLLLDDTELPGRWVVINREFRPASL